MANESLTSATNGTQETSSRYKRVQKRLSSIFHALLVMSIPVNGLLFPFAYFDQNLPLFQVSIGLLLTWFCVAGVALALLDLNPIKRVLIALVIPTFVFGLTFSLGIWLARQLHPSGPQLRSMSLLGLMMPLLCMSVAWMLWLLRIGRGWRITRQRTPDVDGDQSAGNRILEIVCLILCIATSLGLFLIENVLWAGLGLIAGGGVMAVVLVVPLTYWLMKTRRYWQIWLLISLGAPLLILIGIGLFQFEKFWQSGIVFSEEAILASVFMFVFLFPISSFLLALRLQGFRLIYSEPWKRKPSSHKPSEAALKPHPLDD